MYNYYYYYHYITTIITILLYYYIIILLYYYIIITNTISTTTSSLVSANPTKISREGQFSVPETLCEDNSWYCGNCKTLRQVNHFQSAVPSKCLFCRIQRHTRARPFLACRSSTTHGGGFLTFRSPVMKKKYDVIKLLYFCVVWWVIALP